MRMTFMSCILNGEYSQNPEAKFTDCFNLSYLLKTKTTKLYPFIHFINRNRFIH